MDNNVLVPVEQALVPFYGSEILAARLPDGQIAASLGSLCSMLKLAKHGQMERIRRNKGLAEHLLLILVKTPDGPQRIEALVGEEAIRSWVMGIQINRIAPEKLPLIRVLQEEAYETLLRALLKPEAEQTTKPSEPQAAPLPPPPHSGAGAAQDSPWERLFEVLHDIRQEEQIKDEQLARYQRAQAERYALVEERLTSLGGLVEAPAQDDAAELSRLSAFSETHVANVREFFRLLERVTGRTLAQLEQGVSDPFGVPTYQRSS
ncbi:MAG TPA: phage antirepressor N-terminal domain-containing protein [Ktedonobacterales bacterium]|jgi:hypothetical protein